MIAPQATPEELVIQEVEVPLVPKTLPLFPVWLGKTLVSEREVIQPGSVYEPFEYTPLVTVPAFPVTLPEMGLVTVRFVKVPTAVKDEREVTSVATSVFVPVGSV